MYFYLTKKSGHSVKSQSPAGQSAAHFTLRNSPRPKGITKLVRERGYCPHLVHVELQQSIMLVPCCSKNGLSLGPYMTNLTFNFSQNNSNWLWSLTPKRKKKKKGLFCFSSSKHAKMLLFCFLHLLTPGPNLQPLQCISLHIWSAVRATFDLLWEVKIFNAPPLGRVVLLHTMQFKNYGKNTTLDFPF